MSKNVKRLLLSIALCQATGLIGTFFTISSIPNWYNLLNQPSFGPPNWVFGSVWTILYTLMGISFYLIWKKLDKAKGRDRARVQALLGLFLVHLFFNGIWSILFFGMHDIFLALLDIGILWVLIVWLILRMWSVNKLASLLLIPYLSWVSFACILNYSIWVLNK